MADNVEITAGSGTVIGTDEVGTTHYQRIKLGATVPLFADDLADCWVNGEAGDIFWWSAG